MYGVVSERSLSAAPAALTLLREGALTLVGLLPWSSNYTFLGQITRGDERLPVVYKPTRGERPLWDFRRGTLAGREVAAYEVSRALGWDFIPPTVLRDGPHGVGSVQLFVTADQDAHFFTFHEDPAFRRVLQSLALFDVVVNNADRKGGHCLRVDIGRIVAIDHGLCFHVEPKLRTVIWQFAGEPIPVDLVVDLRRLVTDLATTDSPTAQALARLIAPAELTALRNRLADLLSAGHFPALPEDRRPYPWPPV